MDGLDALPDAGTQECEYRDESARAGVQHETRDADCGDRTAFGDNSGIGENFVRKIGLFGAIQTLTEPIFRIGEI